MPVYEYVCGSCGAKMAVPSAMGEAEARVPCRRPECSGIAHRKFSIGGLIGGRSSTQENARRQGRDAPTHGGVPGVRGGAAARIGRGIDFEMIGCSLVNSNVVIEADADRSVVIEKNWISGVPVAIENASQKAKLTARGNRHRTDSEES